MHRWQRSAIAGTAAGLVLAALAFWLRGGEPRERRRPERFVPQASAPTRAARSEIRELLARAPTMVSDAALEPEPTAPVEPSPTIARENAAEDARRHADRRGRRRGGDEDAPLVTVEGTIVRGSCPGCGKHGPLPARLQLEGPDGPLVVRLGGGDQEEEFAIDPDLPISVSGWMAGPAGKVLVAHSLRQGDREIVLEEDGRRPFRRRQRK